jgi:hypothetical protein
MPSDYPGALDTLVNPTSTTARNAGGGLALSEVTSNANDAIEAIQATLGVDPQGSESTVADRLDTIEAGGGGGGGLVKLYDASFTTQASINPGAILDGTYRHYLVLIDITGTSTDQEVSFRLRASGTDDSSAVYDYALSGVSSANTARTVSTGQAQTAAVINRTNGSGYMNNAIRLLLFNPAEAVNTGVMVEAIEGAYGVGNMAQMSGGISHRAATAWDSFSIYVGGTITGHLAVYGYEK